MKQSFWLKIALALGLLFLYLPILMMIVYSFNASTLVNIWGGWTLNWYHILAQDNDLISAAVLSIQIAVSASSVALVLGTMIAFVIKRYGAFRGRNFFYGMTITPIVMPDVVTGLSLLLLFVGMQELIGFPNSYGFITILIGHTTFCTAYATIVIQARLGSIDRSIEEAAMDLGARPTKTFFFITLPQIASSLVAAWLLSFTLSIDNLVITSFISGPSSTTLPLYIYSTIRNGVTPEINALATIMICIVIAGLSLGVWLLNKYGKKALV
ncbi:MAG: binding--dependent transport system inner rane component family protein [Gammaproteobacteria bacterium]|jgi:putrescine transport system permease protein|nr:binding--dependent transport system inner rane component family protein [Gammaproteobacteria bacterium]